MNVRSHVEILQMPNTLHNLWRGKHPTAANAAQAISLSQTIGAEKNFRINMERAVRVPLPQHFQIDFIDDHPRADSLRDLADFTQCGFRRECSCGIVQIAQDNQPSPW